LAKKVLILSPYPILPLKSGGKVRTFELAKKISQKFQTTLVFPVSFSQIVDKKINQKLTLKTFAYPFLFPYLFTDKPFPFMYLISFHPGVHLFLRNLLTQFDIYQFEHASFAKLLDYIPKDKKVIYDAHNVEYDYVLAECRSKRIKKLTGKRIYELEKKILERSNAILSTSKGDSIRFQQLYNTKQDKILVIENGINLEYDPPGLDRKFHNIMRYDQRAIFSGSDVEHNRNSVRYILEHIAPELEASHGFIIKGPCGQRFKHYSNKNVFFDLSIDPLKFAASASTVALNPMIQGSGTSMKILDYLKHCLPVISTDFGMRGYNFLKH
jgi:glycosyltransferase involved in cell wall biosynthesis